MASAAQLRMIRQLQAAVADLQTRVEALERQVFPSVDAPRLCLGLTLTGERCKRPAMRNADFCDLHVKESAA